MKRIGQTVFVCEECETTWFSAGGIGNAHPKNFVDFMESIGLQGLWTEVEQLPNDTEPE
ncbi:MAG TPA: hypothetical protein PKD61_17695 [Polyangiaceae bacterium]|nr:hypothetical protein [Polyangiaceae bacterium]